MSIICYSKIYNFDSLTILILTDVLSVLPSTNVLCCALQIIYVAIKLLAKKEHTSVWDFLCIFENVMLFEFKCINLRCWLIERKS